MASDARVELDWSQVERAMPQLARGLQAAGPRVGAQQAARVASEIRGNVPVHTGRLRSTVGTRRYSDGAGVTYGGALPYADYIEGRTHAVEDALDSAPDDFQNAMTTAAEQEIARL